jgi:hypothetical protein
MEREAVILPTLPPNLLECSAWIPTWQTSLATGKMARLLQGQEMCVMRWEGVFDVNENPRFEKLVSLGRVTTSQRSHELVPQRLWTLVLALPPPFSWQGVGEASLGTDT